MNISKEVLRYQAERRESDIIAGTYKPVKNMTAVKRHNTLYKYKALVLAVLGSVVFVFVLACVTRLIEGGF